MSSSPNEKQPRRRASKKVDPIDIDELLNRPSMQRFDSLLSDGLLGKSTAPVPVAAEAREPAPNPAAPCLAAPNIGAPDLSATESVAITIEASESDAAEVNLDSVDFSSPALIIRPQREYRIRESRNAGDGHSKSEQATYDALWRLGGLRGRIDPQDRVRIVGIGDRALSKQADVSYSTCRAATAALQEKLALEIRPPGSPGAPKVFVVYGGQEIVRRRFAAGFTHVEHRTSGVFLFNPKTNSRAPNLLTDIQGTVNFVAPKDNALFQGAGDSEPAGPEASKFVAAKD